MRLILSPRHILLIQQFKWRPILTATDLNIYVCVFLSLRASLMTLYLIVYQSTKKLLPTKNIEFIR